MKVNESNVQVQSFQIVENSLLKGYLKFVYRVNWFIKGFAGLLLVLMSLIVFGAVLSRFIANISIAWVEQIAVFLMAWVVVFGTALAIRARHMIAVEAFAMNLKGNTWKSLKTLVMILSLVFLAILVDAGLKMANLAAMQYLPTLTWISMYWVYIAIPVGACFMILNMVANLIELWAVGEARE